MIENNKIILDFCENFKKATYSEVIEFSQYFLDILEVTLPELKNIVIVDIDLANTLAEMVSAHQRLVAGE